MNTRAAAAKLSWQIIDHGQSLDTVMNGYFDKTTLSPSDRGFIQELIYGTCRWYGELNSIVNQLLRSPIRKKDRIVHFLLLIGIYQLRHLATADHAAVAETVSACSQLNKGWAKKLINGCLRNYLRSTPEISCRAELLSHPEWIRQSIMASWPDFAEEIMLANNQRPPMCIRVNQRQYSRNDYRELLLENDIDASNDPYARDGLILAKPIGTSMLPYFDKGACSVQDSAAQLAADFLQAGQGMTVLDACAAPGGKTAHLLERTSNDIILDALDISQQRCKQLHATISRLKLSAKIITADARDTTSWTIPESGYDRILIDAPCSGLGVIRRHPDIKHHRRASDLEALQKTQQSLLQALWSCLKPGGRLLYMTCSILPVENEAQARWFVGSQNDAMLVPVNHPNALSLDFGAQTLPGVHDMDGFYYCLVEKSVC